MTKQELREIKDWLNRAYIIDKRIKQLKEQYWQLEAIVTRCTSVYSDSVSRGNSDPFERKCELVNRQIQLEAETIELLSIKAEISDAIREVKDPQCNFLLKARYLLCKDWATIAAEISPNAPFDYYYVQKDLNNKACRLLGETETYRRNRK